MKLVNKLSTGLVITGAYATKVRRTLFAQLKEEVKAGHISGNEIARASGELNRLLFEVLVSKLNLDKGDVVRVRIEYVVEEGKIKWRFGTLEIEAFRRIPDADVREAIQEVLKEGLPSFTYEITKLGTTPIGDEIYRILENGEEVGILVATPADDEVIVRGALRNPPRIIEKTKLSLQNTIEETVSHNIQVLSERAKPAADEVVEKVIKEIEDLL